MKSAKVVFHSLYVIGVLCFMVACSRDNLSDSGQKVDEKEKVAVPVEVSIAEQGEISAVYANTASLEAEQEAVVVAKSSEIIVKIFVEEGDTVKRGQILAQLDTEKLKLELNRSKANLSRLESELERSRQMYQKQLVSSDVFEKVQFDYQAQKAAFELTQLELEHASVVAPIDGVISERKVKTGNMIRLNEPMFKITDFDPLHAVIYVPEKELNKLRVDQLAILQADAVQDQSFNGYIKRISPVIDSSSGTFKVTVELRDPLNRLRPGMFARLAVVYAQRPDALLIDKNALIADEETPSVFMIKDNLAIKTPVVIGFSNESQIEIVSGLSVGDHVVIAGQNSLKNDSKVEILNLPDSSSQLAKAEAQR